MDKLEKLYSIITNSEEVGVELGNDVLRQVESLEEQIIKDEILPALSQDIAPRLNPIRRELVLVVEYHPDEPIRVALSRKTKISEIIDAKTLTPRSGKPVTSEAKLETSVPHEATKHVENPTKGLQVTFPDGIVVWNKSAIDTFVNTLKKIGFERVAKVKCTHCDYNLVGRVKRPVVKGVVWQHECDGWFIYSNISNKQKIADLVRISEYYHLNLKIEECKPK